MRRDSEAPVDTDAYAKLGLGQASPSDEKPVVQMADVHSQQGQQGGCYIHQCETPKELICLLN